jgi:hypothetical protein
VKASAGQVYSLFVSNINAAVRYLKLYNKASAPTVGTDVPCPGVRDPRQHGRRRVLVVDGHGRRVRYRHRVCDHDRCSDR